MKLTKLLSTAAAVATAAVLACALIGCTSSQQDAASDPDTSAAQSAVPAQSDQSKELQGEAIGPNGYIDSASGTYASGTWYAKVKVKGYDEFTIELDADAAPVTVNNFCKLADNGFYDGLAFYRVVEGFCLQGGSAGNTAASGGDGLAPIVGEFAENGVNNPLADDFEKGTVAMARTNDPNSATSTFFITLGSDTAVKQSLNGLYAAFGTIDKAGMKTVDKIVASCVDKADADMGILSDEADMPVIESIEISSER